MKIGCSLYSFKYIRLPTFEMFLKACLRRMYQYNILYFELPLWNGFTSWDAIRIKQLIPGSINSYSIHLPKSYSAKDVLESTDMLEGIFRLESKIAVLHVRKVEELDHYAKLVDILKKHGCKLCVEFIAYDMDSKKLFQEQTKGMYIALDFFHCVNAGFSIEEVLYRFKIYHIHLNDYQKETFHALCPGDGNLPLFMYLKQLEQLNYEGVYMLECPFMNEEHYVKQIQYIRGLYGSSIYET